MGSLLILFMVIAAFLWSGHYGLYHAFDGKHYFLKKLNNDQLELFYEIECDYDQDTLKALLQAWQTALDWYEGMTNIPKTMVSFAVVSTTCGNGCGILGGAKIEIQSTVFKRIYRSFAEKGELDHLPFYELGRIFWVYQVQLGSGGKMGKTLHTGYAVFMRSLVMQYLSKIYNMNTGDVEYYFASHRTLLQQYLKNPAYTFDNTLTVGKGIDNELGLGASNLFAAFLFNLYETQGGINFLKSFLETLQANPLCDEPATVALQLCKAASYAAKTDLNLMFKDKWRWPIQDADLVVGKSHIHESTVH